MKLRAGPRRGRGMSLIEVIVVIAIMGLLMAAVAVAVVPVMERARVDRARQDMHTLRTSLKTYYLRFGKYPTTEDGLGALLKARIIERAPEDPWHREYAYLREGGEVRLWSTGPDEQSGSEDDVVDDAAPPRP